MAPVGRMLAWFGVAAGAVYLIYVGGGWWGIYSPYLRVATMLLAAIVLGAWVVVARRDPSWKPRSVMWPAIAACLGSLAISTLFSRIPRVSIEYLAYAVVLAALYLLLVRLFARPFFRRRLATLATMLFVVSTVAFLGQVLLGWIRWWELAGGLGIPPLRPGFPGLTYNNPSAALTMVMLLAVPALATFGAATRRGLAVVILILLAIAVVALASGSRAGWFALGITGVIAPVAWLAVASHRSQALLLGKLLLRSRRSQVAVVATGVLVIGLAVTLAPPVLRRFQEGGEDARLAYTLAGLRMFLESPVVGTGPGTWVIQRPHYTIAPGVDYYIPHAHNLEAQTLAELGLVGSAAGVVLLVWLGRLFLGAIRSTSAERRRWGWAGTVGLTYFALHQVLDLYVNMPAFLFAAAIPVAYLDATSPAGQSAPSRARDSRRARANRGWGLGRAVVALAVIGLLAQEIPALQQARATAAADAQDWAAADASARQAAALDPAVSSYQFTAGLTAAWAGDHQASVGYFERVVAQNDLPEAWLNLAAEQAQVGAPEPALASLRSALRLGYQRPAIAMSAGDLALRLGEADLAIDAFAAAISASASLAGDPWWQADPHRLDLLSAAIDRAQAATGTSWEVALAAGLEDVAVRSAGDPAGMPALIVGAWFGEPAAATELAHRCDASPLDSSVLGWCARIASRRGDRAAAASFQERAALMNPSAGFVTAELRVSPEGMIGGQLAGGPADLWSTYTYRRPAPWDVLVPSLLHLRLESIALN
jgi:O-antigen ligase/tetratricopeptide (TPR) repeat protein